MNMTYLVHLVIGLTLNTACCWYIISTTSSEFKFFKSKASSRLVVISTSLTKKRNGLSFWKCKKTLNLIDIIHKYLLSPPQQIWNNLHNCKLPKKLGLTKPFHLVRCFLICFTGNFFTIAKFYNSMHLKFQQIKTF